MHCQPIHTIQNGHHFLPPQPSSVPPPPPPRPPPPKQPLTTLTSTLAVAAAATILSIAAAGPLPSLVDPSGTALQVYYGTAARAPNYGGNSSKDSAEYVYGIPTGWKERLISKVEKGTNGTGSEFYNPKKRVEKEYLTYLVGFRQLAPKYMVLNNLALSDVALQDLIDNADSLSSEERKGEKGQVYYVYEIDWVGAHSLISCK